MTEDVWFLLRVIGLGLAFVAGSVLAEIVIRLYGGH